MSHPALRELLSRTLPFGVAVDLAKNGEDPYEVFDRFPIREVRRACLDRMRGSYLVANSEERVTWVKTHLREMAGVNDEDVFGDLLGWFIFNARHRTIEVDALEFACSLISDYPDLFPVISKVVSGKIAQKPDLYWYVPSGQNFLRTCLFEAGCAICSDQEWHIAERAFRRIVQVRDATFLDMVTRLEEAYGAGRVAPDPQDPFKIPLRTSFLTEVVRQLRMAHRGVPSNSDFAVALKSFIWRFVSPTGVLDIDTDFMDLRGVTRVTREVGQSVTLRVFVKASPEKREDIAQVLGGTFLRCRCEGGMELQPGGVERLPDRPPETRAKFYPKTSSWQVPVYPSKGINRFWLTLFQATEGLWQGNEIAQTAGYIYCE